MPYNIPGPATRQKRRAAASPRRYKAGNRILNTARKSVKKNKDMGIYTERYKAPAFRPKKV